MRMNDRTWVQLASPIGAWNTRKSSAVSNVPGSTAGNLTAAAPLTPFHIEQQVAGLLVGVQLL
jgi:hypothetical protein